MQWKCIITNYILFQNKGKLDENSKEKNRIKKQNIWKIFDILHTTLWQYVFFSNVFIQNLVFFIKTKKNFKKKQKKKLDTIFRYPQALQPREVANNKRNKIMNMRAYAVIPNFICAYHVWT